VEEQKQLKTVGGRSRYGKEQEGNNIATKVDLLLCLTRVGIERK